TSLARAWPPCDASRTLYLRDQTRYIAHHDLSLFFARTSRPVAGLHRHGDLRRHAAGDADRGVGNGSDCTDLVARRTRRPLLAGAAAGAAAAIAATRAVGADRDRD